MEEAMSEKMSYSWENRQILLEAIMSSLGITESDLHEQEPSWTKAKIRESKIDQLLGETQN
jgi:hypothetical protein